MVPLFFMGEEWGETRPFQFFCDFHGALGDAVRQGRRREFARWPQFADPETRDTIPDPNDPATFAASVLDWSAMETDAGSERLALFRQLAAIRSTEIAPRLKGIAATNGRARAIGDSGVAVSWTLGDGAHLAVVANLGGAPFAPETRGRELFRLGDLQRDSWALCAGLAESAS
jgi:maltooligosyltrehalose trehalohydrolase